ncbi:polysialyltransferase family glycosyltransferase [Nocardiopsis oceani]
MTQIFVASRVFGLMSLTAAIDSGLFGNERRVLLVVDNAEIPEIAPSLTEAPGFATLSERFHEVVSYNALIWPHHPKRWSAREDDRTLFRGLLGSHLALGGQAPELVVEAIQGEPSKGLIEIFDDARLTVISDGLASYSPTRDPLNRETSTRFERVVHLDLLPGISPMVLSEAEVEYTPVGAEAFRTVALEVAKSVPDRLDAAAPESSPATALIVGQYLAALNLLSATEETEICVRALYACARAGHRTVAFKGHPMNAEGMAPAMRAAAERAGVRLTLLDASVPVEAWYATNPPELVVGAFSTSLSTASQLYGIPVATVGNGLLLERLSPYENSNRIPLVIADTTMPRLLSSGEIQAPAIPEASRREELEPLIRAVAYCMQASVHPHLREAAETYLRSCDSTADRYFKRKRLWALNLPCPGAPAGKQPKPPMAPPRQSFARRALRSLRRRSRVLRRRLPAPFTT